MNKIIFFELNEVPIKIIEYYINLRPNSWLAKHYNLLNKYETFTENQGHLSPWNTWPTLHRGVPSDKHFISEFNQDLTEIDQSFPPIWKILTDGGISTGVFGSLHSYPLPDKLDHYNFFVPDVFAPNHECFPKHVELFQKLNLKLSRKSARNVDKTIPFKDAIDILLKIRTLGFKPSTILSVGKQLKEERINSWKITRRRTYQTILSFDVFYKLLEKKKPGFVTFFTNHVASSMHRYWAALFPEEYQEMKYGDDWIDTYSNEILFAMDATDKMLNRLSLFIDKNKEYKLVITSSMGQEAVESEPVETKLYINDHNKFFKMLGIQESSGYKVLPAMLPQYNFTIAENHISIFKKNIKGLSVNGRQVTWRNRENNFYSIDLGYKNLKELKVSIDSSPIAFEETGLENMVIQDKSSSTAYHIPEGHLFSYHPSNKGSKKIESQLMTCDILPILMNNFNLKKSGYMSKTVIKEL